MGGESGYSTTGADWIYGLYRQLHVIRMTLLSLTFVFESGHETGYALGVRSPQ